MCETRILVVDDEATVLESIRMILAHYGYSVETATSGLEALAKLQTSRFRVVVTDRKMPGMTGEQLAAEIKRHWPVMPVLMLTGYPPDSRPPCVEAILLKPFSMVSLHAAINSLLG